MCAYVRLVNVKLRQSYKNMSSGSIGSVHAMMRHYGAGSLPIEQSAASIEGDIAQLFRSMGLYVWPVKLSLADVDANEFKKVDLRYLTSSLMAMQDLDVVGEGSFGCVSAPFLCTGNPIRQCDFGKTRGCLIMDRLKGILEESTFTKEHSMLSLNWVRKSVSLICEEYDWSNISDDLQSHDPGVQAAAFELLYDFHKNGALVEPIVHRLVSTSLLLGHDTQMLFNKLHICLSEDVECAMGMGTQSILQSEPMLHMFMDRLTPWSSTENDHDLFEFLAQLEDADDDLLKLHLESYIAQVVSACLVMHKEGVTHNDLHVGNTFIHKVNGTRHLSLTYEGKHFRIPIVDGAVVKIIDFGMSNLCLNVPNNDVETSQQCYNIGGSSLLYDKQCPHLGIVYDLQTLILDLYIAIPRIRRDLKSLRVNAKGDSLILNSKFITSFMRLLIGANPDVTNIALLFDTKVLKSVAKKHNVRPWGNNKTLTNMRGKFHSIREIMNKLHVSDPHVTIKNNELAIRLGELLQFYKS